MATDIFTYKKIEDANDALEFFGNFVVDTYKNANYAAVVKVNTSYKIEFGTENGNPIKIKKRKLIKYLKKVDKKFDFIQKFLPSAISTQNDEDVIFEFKSEKIEGFIISNEEKVNYKVNSENSKIYYSKSLRGGIHISNKYGDAPGTLGGVFQLEGFPNEYFGISNWHVLGNRIKRGSPIYHPGLTMPNEKEIGTLAWKCLDNKLEVAFAHLNLKKFPEGVNTKNTCGYELSGEISTPKFDDEVIKCGITTGCNIDEKGNCKYYNVHSTNAIVKVYSTRYPKNKKKFSNQILIEKFSEGGDSGALVVNSKKDVLGLHFGRTKDKKLSVANNISNIFNCNFPINQKIKVNNTTYRVNTFKLKQLI